LEKICWLRRGVRWRLTCASKRFGNYGLKKNQSRSYLNHLVNQVSVFSHLYATFFHHNPDLFTASSLLCSLFERKYNPCIMQILL
jgi:hypothetical protein